MTTANIFQLENIKPKVFTKKNANTYFIDFGKDAFASLQLNYSNLKTDTLIIRVGEELKDGQINRKPGGTIKYQEVKMVVNPTTKTYQLNLKADARNIKSVAVALPDSFPVLIPFRYCEIENTNANIEAKDITQKAYSGYFEYNHSHFSSSDTVLNKVWDMCKYTI